MARSDSEVLLDEFVICATSLLRPVQTDSRTDLRVSSFVPVEGGSFVRKILAFFVSLEVHDHDDESRSDQFPFHRQTLSTLHLGS